MLSNGLENVTVVSTTKRHSLQFSTGIINFSVNFPDNIFGVKLIRLKLSILVVAL